MSASSLWLMGMHGAGKSTCAHRVAIHNKKAIMLDADQLRRGLNSDLLWSDKDRVENARRIAWVAEHLIRAGFFPVVACQTPLKEMRLMVRSILPHALMVFLDAPVEELSQRRGCELYKQAAEAPDSIALAGVTFPFERPEEEEGIITVPNLTGRQGDAFRLIFDSIEAIRP